MFALFLTSRKWGRLPDPGYSPGGMVHVPSSAGQAKRGETDAVASSPSKPVSCVPSSLLISAPLKEDQSLV